MIRFIIFCFCIATLFLSVTSEIVKFDGCGITNSLCDINEVRVKPCKEAKRNQACRIKTGSTASIEVDFTPKTNVDKLISQPYWYNGFNSIAFVDMDTDGCKTTSCPLQNGVQQTYTYSLPIKSVYPFGLYTVRWFLKSQNDDQCCFSVKLKLVR